MNIDSGDSSLPDDHGFTMDSVAVTHDNPSENLDSILYASTEDPGIHPGPSTSQPPPSTTVGGDMRCVNCGLNVSRIRKHTLNIAAVRNLIQRWIESQQVQVSSDSLVCQSCWTIAWEELRHPTTSQPIVGHVSICTKCGKSVFRKQSHELNTVTPHAAAIRNRIIHLKQD